MVNEKNTLVRGEPVNGIIPNFLVDMWAKQGGGVGRMGRKPKPCRRSCEKVARRSEESGQQCRTAMN